MFSRSCGSCCISWMKPWPSPPPMMFSPGTFTSLKNSSEVSFPSMPILCRFRPRWKPSAPSVSTTISEVPLAPSAGSVLATTMMKFASWPLVMKVLDPFTTYWLPVLMAVVLTPCRSDPVPGSVMAMAPTSSPDCSRGSQRAFCSAVP